MSKAETGKICSVIQYLLAAFFLRLSEALADADDGSEPAFANACRDANRLHTMMYQVQELERVLLVEKLGHL